MTNISSGVFNGGMRLAVDFAVKRNYLPILRNVLIEKFGDVIIFRATNLQFTIQFNITVSTQENVDDDFKGVLVDRDVKGARTHVELGDNYVKFNGITYNSQLPTEDFPPFNEKKDEVRIANIKNVGDLKAMCKFAMQDDSNEALHSVHINTNVMEAADGFRMMRTRRNFIAYDDGLIPLEVAKWLVKAKAMDVVLYENSLSCYVEDKKYIFFVQVGWEWNMGRPTFPDTNPIMPKITPETGRFSFVPEHVMEAIGGYAGTKYYEPIISVDAEDNVIRFTHDAKNDDDVTLDATVYADGIIPFKTFDIHATYLMDAMKGLDKNLYATLYTNDPNTPILIMQNGIEIVVMPRYRK